MSALICQRPSSIDRRDKRLGNGHARARRHRIKAGMIGLSGLQRERMDGEGCAAGCRGVPFSLQ